jgi:TRAP-type mannitol/chloroaromatic compound transport system permease small subunit
MFLLLCGILAVAGVERLDRNVRNDLISSRFPQRMEVIALKIIFPFLALLFVAVLMWKSVGNALYALRIGQISASPWAVPLAPIKFVIPAGYLLLCLVLIGKFIRGFASLKQGKKPGQEE